MSEQQTTTNQTATVVKAERSAVNQSCRLSYDCLIASSKTFLHHFLLLSDEEKAEYKSLGNHVKQLSKCNEVIKKTSSVKRVSTPKVSTTAEVATSATEVATSTTEVAAPVEVATTVSKGKKGSKKSSEQKEEHSPTAQVATSIVSEQKKGGRAKKTEAVAVTEAVTEAATEAVVVTEQVAEPVVAEQTKKSAPKKANTASKAK